MQRDEIRLECLKLVYRRDRSPDENLRDAKLFEDYLVQDSNVSSEKIDEKPRKKRGRPSMKSVGNSNDLFD